MCVCVCVCDFLEANPKNREAKEHAEKTPERHTAPAEGLMNYPDDQSAQAINTTQKSYLRYTLFFLFFYAILLYQEDVLYRNNP